MASRLRNTELALEPGLLRLTRAFEVPRALAWLAWIDPVHLAQWWGPPGLPEPDCEIDARPGGQFRVVLRGPDGQSYPTQGEFRELVPGERLVLTQDWTAHPADWQKLLDDLYERPGPAPRQALLSVDFHEFEGRTLQHWRMDFGHDDALRDALLRMGLAEGWTKSFERLEGVLGGLGATS
jgi:uncharacterized protein YndB with AHSA1/START domain